MLSRIKKFTPKEMKDNLIFAKFSFKLLEADHLEIQISSEFESNSEGPEKIVGNWPKYRYRKGNTRSLKKLVVLANDPFGLSIIQ